MITCFYILQFVIISIFCSLCKHDLFEWIGLIGTLVGVWFAFVEIRKSRKTTELSNKQCLFDRRLRCYFINKNIYGELDNNWNCLQQILESDKKEIVSNINIAFQLFVGTSVVSDYFASNEDIFEILDCYNSKVSKIEIVPEESRIVFNHLKSTNDVGRFTKKYIDVLYTLHLARQCYGGNAASEENKDKIYNKLCNAVRELDIARKDEQNILNEMRDELNLEKGVK